VSLIDIRNLHKRFGQLVVLDGLDLAIPDGQSIVIIGASGTGKSVLLKHIVGLLKPDSGEVWYDGKRIDTMQARELDEVRIQFGFLFQMGALFDSFNVEDNIAFPLREHSNKSAAEISRIVDEKLAMVGLPEVRKKMPGQLSGGQRKRIALARAIAMNPRVILYDEPTTGLDPVRSDVINELILKLQRELQVTSITVTHDMHSAFKVADRIVMLREGRAVFDGTADEIRASQDPRIRNFVVGEAGPEDLEGLDTGRGNGAPAREPQVLDYRGPDTREQETGRTEPTSPRAPAPKPDRQKVRKRDR
jgi:phospholipid/cholesterol/gamma-HCH transport system ATP-binding protein